MGRRRTLINDFGANWTTERVSAKKKMHGWTTNMIVIQIIIRFRVISLIMNIAIIRIITLEPLYCIASFHTLFPEFFLLFSYQFYLFFLFSYQFLFFMFPLEFFSLFSHFFSVFSVYQVLYSVIRCKHAKKKRKKCDVWCQRCHRGQIKLRFAKHEEKVWIGWTVFLFTVPKIHA